MNQTMSAPATPRPTANTNRSANVPVMVTSSPAITGATNDPSLPATRASDTAVPATPGATNSLAFAWSDCVGGDGIEKENPV